ncbi:GNAT family N-acetyltransferase [Pedobacter aquatilis]|uniref:GNAT family N-acetyltransferase n=1 Tax=Pedobacter aquatilis TaxID=351343 RepID=UPI0025B5BF8A|nr:GNAT family N-acetyltransferase [Pedobacter aquatilis]MDN3585654.1 GNAT family N-acetyltransferase [Pedobacter aquatilis]
MKIDRIFSIRIFDGKKDLRDRILIFSKSAIAKADLLTRIDYDAQALSKKLDQGTVILLMLEEQVCAMARYQVHPTRNRPENIHRKDMAWISDFAVLPTYWQIGLARMLLEVIRNYSRYLGKNTLRILAPTRPNELKAFLLHSGFTIGSSQPGFPLSFLGLALRVKKQPPTLTSNKRP